MKSSMSTPAQLASFLAASSPHSGEWLQAMPISSCGLRLDDEAVRIGVGMWLGVPHYCGALVDAHRDCTALSVRKLRVDRPGI